MSRRVSSAEARDRIVEATARLLRERPYRELSVDLVMGEAGLSRTVFYRHFDGMAAVVLSLLDEIGDELYAALVSEPSDDVLAAAVDAFAEHGQFLRALIDAAGQDARIEAAYRALSDRFIAKMTEQFTGSIEAGMVAAHDPAELARAMHLFNSSYLLDTLGRDPDFDRGVALKTLQAIWHPLLSSGS